MLIAAVVFASCAGDGAANTTTTSTQPPTTGRPDTTTTGDASTPTTTPPPTTSTTEGDPLAPEGSGCAPGPGDLPDGEWYGGVRRFDDQGISFDLACFFVGDAATSAAAEDGEESPPPNDYYVRNQNAEARDLTIDADTPVTWYPSGDPSDVVNGTFVEWVDYLATRESYLAIWVTIDDGVVTMVEEQWVP